MSPAMPPESTTPRDEEIPIEEIVGKTVKAVEYGYDDRLTILFTDASVLEAYGVWHNDSSAGTGLEYTR